MNRALRLTPFAIIALSAARPALADVHSYTSPYPVWGSIERLDPAADQLLAKDARIEKLADGLTWTEGPLWLPDSTALIFADMGNNRIAQWKEREGVTTFLQPSGWTGEGASSNSNNGSNGMALDPKGRLVICQHGDHAIAWVEPDTHTLHTIIDRYHGKRLNSPNDLIFDAQGNLFFTDPPYGVKADDRELDFAGVYKVTPDGKVTVIDKTLKYPNGIGFSPDGKTLYVSEADREGAAIYAYTVAADGTIGERRMFWDVAALKDKGPGIADGMSIDALGNVWTTGPGGFWVLSPAGKPLVWMHFDQRAANCCFGGPDRSTLFITANATLARVQTKANGL